MPRAPRELDLGGSWPSLSAGLRFGTISTGVLDTMATLGFAGLDAARSGACVFRTPLCRVGRGPFRAEGVRALVLLATP